MKKIFPTLIFAFISFISVAQNQTNPNDKILEVDLETNPIYQLFPTENYWTFIKLDTRNGKMWQIYFTVEDDGTNGEIILNPITLVVEAKEVNGRFTLHPTKNMYNFLLLDQIDGDVYQVQWSMEEEYRGVVPIY